MTETGAKIEEHPEGLRLALSGDVDLAQGAGLRATFERLVPRPGRALVVDLTGVTFLDSSGISTLLAGRAHWTGGGGSFSLVVPAALRRTFVLAGLAELMEDDPPG